MAVQSVSLTEDEAYLLALIQDESGIDLAEFLWEDQMADNVEKIFRCWDFQYAWWRDTSTLILDACARAVGKTFSIIVRGWAFAIQHPGAEMVVTAPELIHLQPLTSRIEDRIKETRLSYELLPRRPGRGFKHRPFQVDFANGAKILGRIPQRDGKGVKGLHPLRLEMDEAQDFPEAGWVELVETLRHGEEGAQWRAHGVSRGVHDQFYRHSESGSGWSVHRLTGMHRPTWSDQERRDKIEAYGSRDNADYKRNILGLHGDATNPMFVLHRLMATVDDDPASEYNADIYYHRRIMDEMLEGRPIEMLLDIPHSHKQWQTTWAGMDVGMTQAPSEILVFGEETVPRAKDKMRIRLLSRIHLERIQARDQRAVVAALFDFYDLTFFAIDRGGVGLPLFQDLLADLPKYADRIGGYDFGSKIVIGWEDHEDWEDKDDYEIRALVKEFGYDTLRTYVDQKRIALPYDQELLGEWNGQNYSRVKSTTSPYGKKSFSQGSFHTLDAAAMVAVGKELKAIEILTKVQEPPAGVPLIFV
jgi:hypothetical protein